MLGPCSYFYYNNKNSFYNKNSNASFSLGKNKENKIIKNHKIKKENDKQWKLSDNNDIKYNQWIKKTYNMSFV